MPKNPAACAARTFPIVGIGASAGGLEAVTALLAHLPTDTGMAFVVVQHMDPARESLLPPLLQKATAMPVSQARDGAVIAPDRVYVIPPNTHMIVDAGRLRLIPRPAGIHAMSVNCFLNSLAEELGHKAVAVIMSGTASDGTLGVKAIKAEGGIVFAQDELSAGFSGMPHSAAATGVVDFVLPPEQIAAELVSIARHPALSPEAPEFSADEKLLGRIFQLLRDATGVEFSLYKFSTVHRRLQRRLMLHKLSSLEEYVKLLEADPDSVRALHDDLLIHVTRFFREPKCVAVMRAKAFARILKSVPPGATIRAWVPGCSSGEEAYSLAISLLDYLSEKDSMNPIQIFATDISEVALARARAGVYSEEIRHDVPARLLRRFFSKVERGYEIAKRVREVCVFARHDLTKDAPFANVALISCCNVLIYLAPDAQKRILPMFHYSLRPSGALMLGGSESVGEFGGLFASADKKCRLFYKKAADAVPRASLLFAHGTRGAGAVAARPPTARAVWPETDVLKAAESLLLARYAPAGVIVDGDLTVLHFRGRISRYLEPVTGKANLSLLSMLPAHAAGPMKALIQKARKADSPIKEKGVDLEGDDGGRARKVSVEAVPFRLPLSGRRYFIVLFEDDSSRSSTAAPALPSRPDAASTKRLKSELAATRSYLQTVTEEHEAVNEELKAANEEVTSSNEELQSTNEELEIAKEELQAANEELSTVNDELQTRNGDLGRVNDDLLNLISSVDLPIVMVSSDLCIRRFSAAAEKVMNLIPGDVGRPIGDITPKLALPNFEEIIREVIETVTVKELEVRDAGRHSYAVRIRPYKTADNKIDGAVVVFIDNDPIQRGHSGTGGASAFEAALDLVQEPLAILDGRLRVRAGSRTLYQTLGLSRSAQDLSLFEIERGRWNVPELRARLERLASRDEPFDGLIVRVQDKTFSFSARRIAGENGDTPQVLLAVRAEP